MPTPAELYVKGIKKKFRNYFAAWLPNEPLKLGDVGILEENFFTRITSLQELGISFQEREDPDSSPIDFVSESGVSFAFKSAGETNPNLPGIPEAKAGIGIEFSQEGTFVVKAEQSFEPSIENIAGVQKEVLEAFKEGKWEKRWAIIVRIVKTPVASILISTSSQSKIELSVESDITKGTIDLGNANIEFIAKTQKGGIFKSIGATNITPFFQLARIKRRWWFGEPYVRLRRSRLNWQPLDIVTPQIVRDNSDVADSLYLDIVLDFDNTNCRQNSVKFDFPLPV